MSDSVFYLRSIKKALNKMARTTCPVVHRQLPSAISEKEKKKQKN